MEEESWEVEKIVNDRILLISSAANIRRKEMQSRSKESAKNPEPSGGTVSIEEAKKLIKESMEKDDRGIKKRNPKSSGKLGEVGNLRTVETDHPRGE